MCQETIEVLDLADQRTAYEVEEFLNGVPAVTDASADFLSNTVVVEYDESVVSHDTVLDYIEHAGCKPAPRANGIIDRLTTKFRAR